MLSYDFLAIDNPFSSLVSAIKEPVKKITIEMIKIIFFIIIIYVFFPKSKSKAGSNKRSIISAIKIIRAHIPPRM